MTNLSDDEDIPELVEAQDPTAGTTEPLTSRRKLESLDKVPITIVTGSPTSSRFCKSILITW